MRGGLSLDWQMGAGDGDGWDPVRDLALMGGGGGNSLCCAWELCLMFRSGEGLLVSSICKLRRGGSGMGSFCLRPTMWRRVERYSFAAMELVNVQHME